VVECLRHPEYGCPWDKEQTHESLKSYLIEESYEVLESIDENEPNHLKEELGDLLLQIFLHSQLSNEENQFCFKDVADSITNKMISRHPHVFSSVSADTSEKVLSNWEKIKAKEKADNNNLSVNNTLTDKINSIPKSLPALLISERIGDKSGRFSFDWSKFSDVKIKLKEELDELEKELVSFLKNKAEPTKPIKSTDYPNELSKIEDELGDCLFTLAQISRWLGLSAEGLLRKSNSKFLKRVKLMEENLEKELSLSSDEEKDNAWKKAKTRLAEKPYNFSQVDQLTVKK
jgi:MazG family protein